jgi:hypothetical protein
VVRVKGLNLVVPKGTKLGLNGAGLLTIEDPSHYMMRRLEEIDMRLMKIEQKLEKYDEKMKH